MQHSKSAAEVRGDRVELHRFTEECITEEYLAWLNDRQLMRFSRQSTLEHTRKSCLDYMKSFEGTRNILWSVRMNENLQVGTMTAYLDESALIADIGILIGHPAARGQGIGADAWGAAMKYLFDNLHVTKVTGGTVAPHAHMIAIFQRWGMKRENVQTKELVLNGIAYDVVRFGIAREDWLAIRAGASSSPSEKNPHDKALG